MTSSYSPSDLREILDAHKQWLADNSQGRRADLSDADLRIADLRIADLSGADLRDARLWGVTGNMREIRSLQLETWPIAYTAEVMQIGCQRHPIADWWEFSDAAIAEMHKEALDWWRRWKPILRQIIETAPAVATGVEATDEAA